MTENNSYLAKNGIKMQGKRHIFFSLDLLPVPRLVASEAKAVTGRKRRQHTATPPTGDVFLRSRAFAVCGVKNLHLPEQPDIGKVRPMDVCESPGTFTHC